MSHLHQLTDIERACDELELILTAALARLDQRDNTRPEETTMGHCYTNALSTGQQWSQPEPVVMHMLPTATSQTTHRNHTQKTRVVTLTPHRQSKTKLDISNEPRSA